MNSIYEPDFWTITGAHQPIISEFPLKAKPQRVMDIRPRQPTIAEFPIRPAPRPTPRAVDTRAPHHHELQARHSNAHHAAARPTVGRPAVPPGPHPAVLPPTPPQDARPRQHTLMGLPKRAVSIWRMVAGMEAELFGAPRTQS